LQCSLTKKIVGLILKTVLQNFKHYSHFNFFTSRHVILSQDRSLSLLIKCISILLSQIIQKRQEQARASPPDSEWIFLSILANKYEIHNCTIYATLFSCNCLSSACSSFFSLSSTHLYPAIYFKISTTYLQLRTKEFLTHDFSYTTFSCYTS
jgi:hypothetical protein